MSASSILRSRASALREEARFHIGLRRARLVSKAEECERLAGSVERLTFTTVRTVDGAPRLVDMEV